MPSYNPKGFAKRLRKVAENIPKQQNEIKRELAIEALTQIVGDTPVDTGRARDNWNASAGSPDFTVRSGPYGPSRHRGQNTGGSPTRGGNQSINRGRAIIRSARVKPGVPVYISNGLAYIARLNSGYSRQAPSNFVAIAIARAQGIVRRQLRRYAAELWK